MKSEDRGLSMIVKSVALVLAVPAITFGLYVILHGHLTPGGGFPGGAVIATVIALFLVAFGKEGYGRMVSKGSLSALESIGLVLFAMFAFIGIGTSFFHNSLANDGGFFGMPIASGPNPGYLNTGGVIPLMNLAVGLEVFAALSLIMMLIYGAGEGDGK